MVFKKIIFQNRYVALETPSRPPPPLHGKYHLKFPFWLFAPFPKAPQLDLHILNLIILWSTLWGRWIWQDISSDSGVWMPLIFLIRHAIALGWNLWKKEMCDGFNALLFCSDTSGTLRTLKDKSGTWDISHRGEEKHRKFSVYHPYILWWYDKSW